MAELQVGNHVQIGCNLLVVITSVRGIECQKAKKYMYASRELCKSV